MGEKTVTVEDAKLVEELAIDLFLEVNDCASSDAFPHLEEDFQEHWRQLARAAINFITRWEAK